MTLWLPALGGCEWAGAGHRGATGDHKGPHPTQLHPRPYGYREAFTTWSAGIRQTLPNDLEKYADIARRL